MASPRTNSDDQQEKENDVQYKIFSFSKKDNFFKPQKDVFEAVSKEEIEKLNATSSSVQKFKLSQDEEQEIIECNKTMEELDKKINEIGKLQNITVQKKQNLRYCDDIELTELLGTRISHNHKINCKIDRINKLLEITIHNCEDTDQIRYLFKPFLKFPFDLKTEGRAKDTDNDLRIVVLCILNDRDNLVNGLKLSDEIHNIPSARQYFQGC